MEKLQIFTSNPNQKCSGKQLFFTFFLIFFLKSRVYAFIWDNFFMPRHEHIYFALIELSWRDCLICLIDP